MASRKKKIEEEEALVEEVAAPEKEAEPVLVEPAPEPEQADVVEAVEEEDPPKLELVIDEEMAERIIVDANYRKRGIFDVVLITGEGLENKNGRSGIPQLIFSIARTSLKSGGVLIIPKHLRNLAEVFGMSTSKHPVEKGFCAFE